MLNIVRLCRDASMPASLAVLAFAVTIALPLVALAQPQQSSAASDAAPATPDGATQPDEGVVTPVNEDADETVAPPAETGEGESGPVLSMDDRGFSVYSANGHHGFEISAAIEFTSSMHFGETSPGMSDGLDLRRGRLYTNFQLERRVRLEFEIDFNGEGTRALDALIDWEPNDHFRLIFGRTKTLIGLERDQSSRDTLFVERGLTAEITPDRELGVFVTVTPIPGLQLDAAVANSGQDGDFVDAKPLNVWGAQGRILVDVGELAFDEAFTLQFGGAATTDVVRGSPEEPSFRNLPLTTSGRWGFYNEGLFLDGRRTRYNASGLFSYEGFYLMGEFVGQHRTIADDAGSFDYRLTSGMLGASYSVGGDRHFGGMHIDRTISQGGVGAFEFKFQYSSVRVHGDTSRLLSVPSVRHESLVAGLSWWPMPDSRVFADFYTNRFQDAQGETSQENNYVLMLAAQIGF